MLPIRKAFDAILLASMLPSRFETLIVVRLLSVQSISTHLMRFVQCRICSVSVTFAHCRMGCMSVLSHSLCVLSHADWFVVRFICEEFLSHVSVVLHVSLTSFVEFRNASSL